MFDCIKPIFKIPMNTDTFENTIYIDSVPTIPDPPINEYLIGLKVGENKEIGAEEIKIENIRLHRYNKYNVPSLDNTFYINYIVQQRILELDMFANELFIESLIENNLINAYWFQYAMKYDIDTINNSIDTFNSKIQEYPELQNYHIGKVSEPVDLSNEQIKAVETLFFNYLYDNIEVRRIYNELAKRERDGK